MGGRGRGAQGRATMILATLRDLPSLNLASDRRSSTPQTDADAIAKAHARLAKRKGRYTALEVWDGARLVFRERLSARTGTGQLQPATGPASQAAE